jgi:hypothetical protein
MLDPHVPREPSIFFVNMNIVKEDKHTVAPKEIRNIFQDL